MIAFAFDVDALREITDADLAENAIALEMEG